MIWAVHISDGVLEGAWLAGGFVLAALLALLGAWRIRDEEIPRIALLTAAFFVASQIHIPGPSSVHLLLNGLLGVVLGFRACLAIPVGVFLQVALFGHGGYSTLGVNSCVMVLPALMSWWLFALFQRMPWLRRQWFRAGLVALSTLVWTLSLVYALALVSTNHTAPGGVYSPLATNLDMERANSLLGHPLTWALALSLAALAVWAERRLENAPEFPLGLLIGELAVLATAVLNCLVLLGGGPENIRTLALLVLLAHLSIAVVEGLVLGFTVGFLVRVKPQMLHWPTEAEPLECRLN